jgi:carbonic anhydrase
VTSVIVRSSVNVGAGGKTKMATITHGVLMAGSALFLPGLLNQIPLAALAAILIMTGIKLASPSIFRQMWKEGWSQFLPFVVTIVAIVLTDLLIGIGIGLVVAVAFILQSNFRRPLRRVMEKHIGGDVLRIELANQVSFLNRAVLAKTLAEVPRNTHVLIDARNTDYIDPDIRDLIEDFMKDTAPAHGVEVSLVGFKDKNILEDRIQYVDFSSREAREALTPQGVLDILKAGNERFLEGRRLTRDFGRNVDATADGQYPMAVVLSCIDSRVPAELIFDLGLGDIFSIRIAGTVAKDKVLASMEFGCALAGAKLIVVMGHTSCGAIKAAVDLYDSPKSAADATGCDHMDSLVCEIHKCIDGRTCKKPDQWDGEEKQRYVDSVVRRQVLRTMDVIRERSHCLNGLIEKGKVDIVGAIYDVRTGKVDFFKAEPRTRQEDDGLLMAGE